ncbi:MAG: hypothetical protein ACOC5T_07455 [Elusimicrobiota bacterium]
MKRLILIGIVLLLLVGCQVQDSSEILDDPQEECARVGGEWKTFPNTCVDSCEYRRGEVQFCGQALTEGCECGTNKCWNGETCVEE